MQSEIEVKIMLVVLEFLKTILDKILISSETAASPTSEESETKRYQWLK